MIVVIKNIGYVVLAETTYFFSKIVSLYTMRNYVRTMRTMRTMREKKSELLYMAHL